MYSILSELLRLDKIVDPHALASVLVWITAANHLCFQEAAERCVVRLQGRTDGDSEEDLDEEASIGSEIHLRRQVTSRWICR